MKTLKCAFSEYLETRALDSDFEEGLSDNKYLCWSIPHEQRCTVWNWLGEKIGTETIRSRRYVWLGNKGAIYVTKTSRFAKKDASDTNVHHDMKTWVWSKYFNINFNSDV